MLTLSHLYSFHYDLLDLPSFSLSAVVAFFSFYSLLPFPFFIS